jgi:hypothetical protein
MEGPNPAGPSIFLLGRCKIGSCRAGSLAGTDRGLPQPAAGSAAKLLLFLLLLGFFLGYFLLRFLSFLCHLFLLFWLINSFLPITRFETSYEVYEIMINKSKKNSKTAIIFIVNDLNKAP